MVKVQRGYTEKGTVKRSMYYQPKKHVTQMTRQDIATLYLELRKIKRLSRDRHFKDRIAEGKMDITLKDIFSTIREEELVKNIIEYNETYIPPKRRFEQRVLIRMNKVYPTRLENKKGITNCHGFVVINLTTKSVTTGYLNECGDNHDQLNLKRYCADMIVRPLVKGGISWKNRPQVGHFEQNFLRFNPILQEHIKANGHLEPVQNQHKQPQKKHKKNYNNQNKNRNTNVSNNNQQKQQNPKPKKDYSNLVSNRDKFRKVAN